MSRPASPGLSVVLACTDVFATIAKTVECLGAQTLRDAIELVLVASSRERLGADPEALSRLGLWDVQIVELGEIPSIAAANAAGVRRARGAVVALAEDHCFPEPEWAAALVRAHEGPWAAVGPVVHNANPASLVSWADFLVGYAPWAAPCPSGEREFLPGHNSSYKRDVLLSYGDGLEAMLDAETTLHFDMRAAGLRLYLESAAHTSHTNIARVRSWVPLQYWNGRIFGGARAQGWPAWRKLAYAAASPLIPPLRLARILRDARRAGPPVGTRVRVLPLLALGLGLDGLGQAMGYLFGRGVSARRMRRYEFRRIDHVSEGDRALFAPSAPAASRAAPPGD